MPALAIVVVLLLGVGVGVGAENALPGDTLYPVKVGVNENVRSAFTLSGEAKADWAARRAERRLEEAENLAEENALSAEIADRIDAHFKKHAEDVEARLADFEAKENFEAAADLSSRFESSLAAHARVLVSLRGGESTDGVDRMVESVQEEYGVMASARVRAEGQATTNANATAPSEASIRARLEALANHLEELQSKITREGAELSADTRAELEAKVNAVESAAINARAKLEAKLTSESAALIRQAERIIVEARLFLEAHKNLNLNFGGNAGGNASTSNNSGSSSAEGEANLRVETGDGGVESETEVRGNINLNLGR